MFILVNYGPPVLERAGGVPDGVLLLEEGDTFLLESGEPLLLE